MIGRDQRTYLESSLRKNLKETEAFLGKFTTIHWSPWWKEPMLINITKGHLKFRNYPRIMVSWYGTREIRKFYLNNFTSAELKSFELKLTNILNLFLNYFHINVLLLFLFFPKISFHPQISYYFSGKHLIWLNDTPT